MAGAVQAVLASPVEMFKVRGCIRMMSRSCCTNASRVQVRLQAQYGPNPKRLRDIVGEMYSKYGWRQGIMRGYWVRRRARVSRHRELIISSRRSPSFARFPPTQVSRASFSLRNQKPTSSLSDAGFYAGYEWSKRALQKNLGTDSLPVWATLSAGGVGGLGYWTAWCVSAVADRDWTAMLTPGLLQLPAGSAFLAPAFLSSR